jgi:hypothetical protein
LSILVKFEKNWADEFYVHGFKVYADRAAWDKDVETLPELEFSFGTNEGWEEGDIDESDFTVSEITDDQAATLTTLFGKRFGVFPF